MPPTTRAVIAADSPATAEAGARVAELGGNAADIAVAAGFAATMAEALLCSLSGSGFAMVALPVGGPAIANHVKLAGTPVAPPPPNPAPASSQTIHADQITAQQVRADAIYANKIDADNIQGQIHQSKDVKVGDTRGEIKAPEVTASVIYADEISANWVIANNVYVRDVRRR